LSSSNELKKRFIDLHKIYLESNVWAMAAFYNDSEVSRLNDDLYERWKFNGEKGEPIDYATKSELMLLIRKIQAYAGVSAGEVLRDLIVKGEISADDRKKTLRSLLSKFISIVYRLFLPGSRA